MAQARARLVEISGQVLAASSRSIRDALQPPHVRRDEHDVERPGHEEERDDGEREPGRGLWDTPRCSRMTAPAAIRRRGRRRRRRRCRPAAPSSWGDSRRSPACPMSSIGSGPERDHPQHEDRMGGDDDRPGRRADHVAIGDQRQRTDQHQDQRLVPVPAREVSDRDDRRGQRLPGARRRARGGKRASRTRIGVREPNLTPTNVHRRAQVLNEARRSRHAIRLAKAK